ncbi:hypothetical protein M595_1409 [Lyngbya aestuarii BL J]|uniref:Uncharacterized protein n=1 Tax=Lyngbya aestuarii BL J TaxID=1348334 RepID=U7QMU5_9CYAN|nr:hypothetical protein [Lyngbya aestuarii]ERT08597.1 hypothetical protein M595_1409 [Lyngbya aestuarii BL J]
MPQQPYLLADNLTYEFPRLPQVIQKCTVKPSRMRSRGASRCKRSGKINIAANSSRTNLASGVNLHLSKCEEIHVKFYPNLIPYPTFERAIAVWLVGRY